MDRSAFGGDILARRVPSYFGAVVALFHAIEKGWKVIPRWDIRQHITDYYSTYKRDIVI